MAGLRRREDVAGRFAALAPDAGVRRGVRPAARAARAESAVRGHGGHLLDVPAAVGGTAGISAVAGGSGTASMAVVSASGSGATSGAA